MIIMIGEAQSPIFSLSLSLHRHPEGSAKAEGLPWYFHFPFSMTMTPRGAYGALTAARQTSPEAGIKGRSVGLTTSLENHRKTIGKR